MPLLIESNFFKTVKIGLKVLIYDLIIFKESANSFYVKPIYIYHTYSSDVT